MPFQEKPLNDCPPGTPDVRLLFHGQLILRSDGHGCDVAVNPVATDHVLSIEVRIKKEGKTDRIRMRHLGPLNFREPEGLLIEVAGPGPAVASAAFKLVGNEPIDYENPASAAEDDFRWILNVEGPLFHNAVLNSPVFGAFAGQNVIRLRGGEYYFKTAAMASPRYQYRRRGGNKPDVVIGAIGCIASASVFLPENKSLVMKWQDDTREGDRTLSLGKAEDTTYEVYIENTPLCLDRPREAQLPLMDEFKEYYKVLDVPVGDRFSVVPELRPALQEGTPEVPCQVVTQDGPGPG
jgi:hypothetical protein